MRTRTRGDVKRNKETGTSGRITERKQRKRLERE